MAIEAPGAVLTLEHKLSEFFPPENPESHFLFRLMIVRDDLSFEIMGLRLASDAGANEVWQTTYYLRRCSVSLLEATSALTHEVERLVKKPPDDLMRACAPNLQPAIDFMRDHKSILKPLRDTLGGHVRPADGRRGFKKNSENHPNLSGPVSVAIGNARGTSYRGISQLCLGFAWPDVDTDEGLDAHHDALQKAILNGAALVFQAIDTLLFRFWVLNGIIVPSQGQEIGILNPATGQYEPIRG